MKNPTRGSRPGLIVALPPKSPKEMLDHYRDAYEKMSADPDFTERGKKISESDADLLVAYANNLIALISASA